MQATEKHIWLINKTLQIYDAKLKSFHVLLFLSSDICLFKNVILAVYKYAFIYEVMHV